MIEYAVILDALDELHAAIDGIEHSEAIYARRIMCKLARAIREDEKTLAQECEPTVDLAPWEGPMRFTPRTGQRKPIELRYANADGSDRTKRVSAPKKQHKTKYHQTKMWVR